MAASLKIKGAQSLNKRSGVILEGSRRLEGKFPEEFKEYGNLHLLQAYILLVPMKVYIASM